MTLCNVAIWVRLKMDDHTDTCSPQSNGMAESFVNTLKREYAKLANRPDPKPVMAQLQGWCDDYN